MSGGLLRSSHAREELGINAGTAAKMARLARKLRDRPVVREALRRGQLTPRKEQMCARGTFNVWMTVSAAEAVRAAFRAARAAAKRWLSAVECLVAMAAHFVESWRAHLKRANTVQLRVRER